MQFRSSSTQTSSTPLPFGSMPHLCASLQLPAFAVHSLPCFSEAPLSLLCRNNSPPCSACTAHFPAMPQPFTAILRFTLAPLSFSFPSQLISFAPLFQAVPRRCLALLLISAALLPIQYNAFSILCFAFPGPLRSSPRPCLLCSAFLRNSSTLLCIAMPSHIFSFLCRCI